MYERVAGGMSLFLGGKLGPRGQIYNFVIFVSCL